MIFAIAVFLRLGAFLLLPGHEGSDAPEYKQMAWIITNHAICFIGKNPLFNQYLLSIMKAREFLYAVFIDTRCCDTINEGKVHTSLFYER